MFDDMKQFLTSDICLSCDGCCRFDKEKSDWRAKVGKIEEKKIMYELSLSSKLITKDVMDEGGYLRDTLCHGLYSCTFFNHEDTTCQIYHNRPFECRLYPFVLTRVNNKSCVSIHLPCPFVKETKGSAKYNEYINYLKQYFKEDKVATLCKDNPHLFGEYLGYEDELEWLFDVEID